MLLFLNQNSNSVLEHFFTGSKKISSAEVGTLLCSARELFAGHCHKSVQRSIELDEVAHYRYVFFFPTSFFSLSSLSLYSQSEKKSGKVYL